jgi:hypothetical protein
LHRVETFVLRHGAPVMRPREVSLFDGKHTDTRGSGYPWMGSLSFEERRRGQDRRGSSVEQNQKWRPPWSKEKEK